MTVRISEYYDVFDVKVTKSTGVSSQLTDKGLPTDIQSTKETNPFRGFNNFPLTDPSSSVQAYVPYPNEPSQYKTIAGQHKAPQAITNIRVDENGNIWCYPPNVSVPYWNKVIFRNFDYNVNCSEEFLARADAANGDNDSQWNSIKRWAPWFRSQLDTYSVLPIYTDTDTKKWYSIPKYARSTTADAVIQLWNKDASAESVPPIYKQDWTNIIGTNALISDGSKVPLFLKFDEYPSRSKVIFSSVDKTRNPDIEHKFGYHKGQMEPIKLNLGFSSNQYIIDDSGNTFNANLRLEDILAVLSKCYWSIEWIYERETGN